MPFSKLQLVTGDKPCMQTIPKFLEGQHIFVTGGTGFLGKVLIEKLLRTCPDIGNIYVLVRSKKEATAQERWAKITECQLFHQLKKENQNALKKVIVVEGDVGILELGLNKEDRNALIQNVSIVYHVAATVIFTCPLQKAILLNVRGTREVCSLVLEMKRLSAFVHVSTTFCQCGETQLEERLYPKRGNPNNIIDVAENCDAMTLKIMTSKLMEGFPNTYAFTKCLAETMVAEMCEGKVPLVVYRPSIVVPALNGPVPGWIDNVNGPATIVFPAGKGVLRVLLMKPDVALDYMPVDESIKGLIKATWLQQYKNNDTASVYNNSGKDLINVTPEMFKHSMDCVVEAKTPFRPLWYRGHTVATNLTSYWFYVYLFQIIPSALVDLGLKIIGKKSQLIKVQAKIAALISTISMYMMNDNNFLNDNYRKLDDYLLAEDETEYSNEASVFDLFEYSLTASDIFKTEVLKDTSDYDENKRLLNKLWYLHHIFLTLVYGIGSIFVYNWIVVPLLNGFNNYLINL